MWRSVHAPEPHPRPPSCLKNPQPTSSFQNWPFTMSAAQEKKTVRFDLPGETTYRSPRDGTGLPSSLGTSWRRTDESWSCDMDVHGDVIMLDAEPAKTTNGWRPSSRPPAELISSVCRCIGGEHGWFCRWWDDNPEGYLE